MRDCIHLCYFATESTKIKGEKHRIGGEKKKTTTLNNIVAVLFTGTARVDVPGRRKTIERNEVNASCVYAASERSNESDFGFEIFPSYSPRNTLAHNTRTARLRTRVERTTRYELGRGRSLRPRDATGVGRRDTSDRNRNAHAIVVIIVIIMSFYPVHGVVIF